MSPPQNRLSSLLLLLAVIALGSARAFAAAPTITSFTPTSSKLGNTVTVSGTNFVSPTTVSFDGVASILVTVSSSTKLTAKIPNTAATGKITVKTSGGTATSSTSFTVVPGVIWSNPVGTPASARTVYFAGYGSGEAVDVYFDNTDFALSTTSSTGAGSVAVTVPADALPGSHWVTVVGRHSGLSAQDPFTVRTDWMEFGYRASHPGGNPWENVLSTSTVAQLEEAWRTPGFSSMASTPAIVAGLVYATFADGSLRAFDELTGTQKWVQMIGGSGLSSSPAVSGGIVYVGSGGNGSVYAFDATTGAQKWKYTTGDIVYSSPSVSGGIVYFGSYDNKVYAVNAASGALVWSYTTGGGVFGTPAVFNGVVYVGSLDDNVYAINATTGTLIWQTATGDGVLSSPVIVGGLVCVGSNDEKMYAFRRSDGSVAWTYSAGAEIEGTAAVVGSTLFFGNTTGAVFSVSASGALRWSYTLPFGVGSYSPVCAASEVVYFATPSYTYAFASDSGTLLTTLPVGSNYGGPVVANGAVLLGDYHDGVLARYSLNAAQDNFAAARPAVSQLHPHPLR